MSVGEWYNSVPMTSMREQIKSQVPLTQCRGCYNEERAGYESKRIKENFKSVIFTELAFERSFQQSPMRTVFESNQSHRMPIDWHVDLGNECNLACKMCKPEASSRISKYYTKWQIRDSSANRNWTLDPVAWQNFLTSLLETPRLNRIHFMGGEPLLSRRFVEALDFLLDNNKESVSISFVTNGTILNQSLIDRLKRFRSCDIEISLESIESNNDYIRQGSQVATIKNNIETLTQQQTDRFHVVLRSVPQLLNINNYDQYIGYAWQHQLPIQGIPLINPEYLQISVLPFELRQSLVPRYQAVKESITPAKFNSLATGRSTGTLDVTLRRECDAMINFLTAPEPGNVQQLRQDLAVWLMRWDRELGLDAREYYPEYREFFDDIQYTV